ncbi:MAG: ribonuclease III [Pseudomonadota bacterium]
MNKSYAELYRRLNYSFKESVLLQRALTHRSKSSDNYERLEFLGDSVLGFVISAELFTRYPDIPEGDLTRLRASLVKKQTLALLARELELGDFLALGEGELKSGGFNRDSILADALEAIFGAICMDSSYDETRRVILHLYQEMFARLNPYSIPKDPKTRLQEHLQKHSLPTPIYQICEVTGEAHSQSFVVECWVPGIDKTLRGTGTTRRNAEQQAAALALELLDARK